MRILFAGTPEVAVPSLRALADAGFDVAAVLSRVDAPLGRRKILTPSPVAAAAKDLGLPGLKANRFTPELIEQLTMLHLDAAAIVAYGGIVPPAALAVPEHGWINLHFSVLPQWRGAAPVQHAVLAGDSVTGATTFLLEEGLDTGPGLGVMTETPDPAATSGGGLARLSSSGAGRLVRPRGDRGAGRVTATPQTGEPSAAPKLTIDDARVDWAQPAAGVRRRINAVTPEPGAWTTLAGQRVKLGPVTPLDGGAPEHADDGMPLDRPGPGVVHLVDREVRVGTGSTPVVLGTLQPAGKKTMCALDWARGAATRGELVFE
ncbi:methionyl-tRNA formyltransferase [Arthrobacter sp. RIT-PI-e]|uniref:methionyl-tRNA formyltransferase n=1 Tax=Arthrobacter sp. RIT-PI-e TaxID=1681197 RepID=UPI0006762A59|nr:methionyl-tRNA formyltransferase [Arthrobacter sp. RIT-PI-e]KNC19094.1 methionyl-tRNA formyltransferase [Arthrobacter sp. RIT-PI-e]